MRGTVQGVGFRPFVFRLAARHALTGWVLNGDDGVRIRVEGADSALEAFLADLRSDAPAASRIAAIDVAEGVPEGFAAFEIRASEHVGAPTTRISPDLPVCGACLRELFDPADRRHRYPYVNCTDCGPRFSIVHRLPYDRPRTTMAPWKMCEACAAEYEDPADRRFHAQPTACPACGPEYVLVAGADVAKGSDADRARGVAAIREAVRLLRDGAVIAVKGVGGYHLACDARNAAAVAALRERKFRKEKPFAVMASDVQGARRLVTLTAEAEAALTSSARPIVIAPAVLDLPGVSPDSRDIGVMLPYTPLHHLLFAEGAPVPLVMTSANRSNEPIAFEDDDALTGLAGIADAFLLGERPIARRLDDSIVRPGHDGPVVLRRSRGLAPALVAELPTRTPILAVGADLKNAVTLVVEGQAYAGPHVGDLEHYEALRAFRASIDDLLAMYEVSTDDLVVVHDLHPQYASTQVALSLPARAHVAVQHHRAHVASVLAERGALDTRVVGIAFDGTGYGDDGSIWGGEFFVGSVRESFERVASLRPAMLAGGDAAARHPLQAAAGFLFQLGPIELHAPPFAFPARYDDARQLVARGVRAFETTSAGRLFDCVAALLGFTRPIAFEGQAAMWVEHLARGATEAVDCPFGVEGRELDWRPALDAVIAARRRSADPGAIAAGVHRGLGSAVATMARALAAEHGLETIVLSGGVFQNALLVAEVRRSLGSGGLEIWINHQVPPNDGGVSLGQAALAALARL